MKIIEQKVELLWASPNIEQNVEAAGRTCYKSDDKITSESAPKFCAGLVKSGHYAMIEFGVACFRLTTDKGISHEIVRHRIASYAQESTRWVNYSNAKFGNELQFLPPIGLDEISYTLWEDLCIASEGAYFAMISAGCKPQQARDVLPHSIKTEIVMMMNVRELRHFISLRAAPDAHPKIQILAKEIHLIMLDIAPSLFNDLLL